MAEDYYSTLGVANDATPQDIKKAFRQIARECHPDVAGEDPSAAERFLQARSAYETLIDPVTRARYDRRGQRRSWSGARGGSFFDAFYKNATGAADEPNGSDAASRRRDNGFAAHDAGGHSGTPRGQKNRHKPENDLDLDDLFRDFGDFGFGNNKRRTRTRTKPAPEPPPSAGGSPTTGADVHIELDVPARTARDGGTVTAVYYRMQRADAWRPGSADPGVVRIQDIADVRIIPGTRDGVVLRERGLGDAGTFGGPYGDLVVRVRVVGKVEPPRPEPPPPRSPSEPNGPRSAPRQEPPRAAPTPDAEPPRSSDIHDGTTTLDITLVEALLGGRVPLATPQGTVRLSIPPGTSSGIRMRLKRRGPAGADGEPSDLYVVVRIVVPRQLDDESRKLIERFAELNPGVPR